MSDPIKAHTDPTRWNIREDGASLFICKGDHEASDPCQEAEYRVVDPGVCIRNSHCIPAGATACQCGYLRDLVRPEEPVATESAETELERLRIVSDNQNRQRAELMDKCGALQDALDRTCMGTLCEMCKLKPADSHDGCRLRAMESLKECLENDVSRANEAARQAERQREWAVTAAAGMREKVLELEKALAHYERASFMDDAIEPTTEDILRVRCEAQSLFIIKLAREAAQHELVEATNRECLRQAMADTVKREVEFKAREDEVKKLKVLLARKSYDTINLDEYNKATGEAHQYKAEVEKLKAELVDTRARNDRDTAEWLTVRNKMLLEQDRKIRDLFVAEITEARTRRDSMGEYNVRLTGELSKLSAELLARDTQDALAAEAARTRVDVEMTPEKNVYIGWRGNGWLIAHDERYGIRIHTLGASLRPLCVDAAVTEVGQQTIPGVGT